MGRKTKDLCNVNLINELWEMYTGETKDKIKLMIVDVYALMIDGSKDKKGMVKTLSDIVPEALVMKV